MSTETIIDTAFKIIVGGGILGLIIGHYTLSGRFSQFMTNHWPHFLGDFKSSLNRVERLHDKMDAVDKRVQRMEDSGDIVKEMTTAIVKAIEEK